MMYLVNGAMQDAYIIPYRIARRSTGRIKVSGAIPGRTNSSQISAARGLGRPERSRRRSELRSLFYDAACADSLATGSTGEPYGRAHSERSERLKCRSAIARILPSPSPSPWTEAVDIGVISHG